MSTIDEIKKAKEDIEEAGKDTQSEKDRIDESVAAQEKATGTEDSQDAKDRVDEAEGAKKADEKEDAFARFEKKFDEKFDKLIELLMKRQDEKVEEKVEDEVEDKVLEEKREKYGLGNAVFETKGKADNIGHAEAMEILKKIKP